MAFASSASSEKVELYDSDGEAPAYISTDADYYQWGDPMFSNSNNKRRDVWGDFVLAVLSEMERR